MKSNHWMPVAFLVAGFLGSVELPAEPSFGQEFQPLSRPGGYAGTQLQGIYQQDIGTGYSGQSLNNIALQNARAHAAYAGSYGALTPRNTSPAARISQQPGGSSLSKPFSGFSASPTVSPYLNLFREDFAGNSDLNYSTLVRPQLQQQAFNQQVQRQGMEMTRRMQSIAAQGAFNPQGSKDQYPTGHQTVFKYFGHYHPNAAYRPGKQQP